MKATLLEPEIVTRNGKPVSVILPIEEYRELIERAEDSDDIAWLKQARKKPLRYRPLDDYLAARSSSVSSHLLNWAASVSRRSVP